MKGDDEGPGLGPRIPTFDGMEVTRPRPNLPRHLIGKDVSPVDCECGHAFWVEGDGIGTHRCPYCDEMVEAPGPVAPEIAAAARPEPVPLRPLPVRLLELVLRVVILPALFVWLLKFWASRR